MLFITICNDELTTMLKTHNYPLPLLSYILLASRKIQQQVACFELPRVRSFNFEFPRFSMESV
jgi:hypothetical protein